MSKNDEKILALKEQIAEKKKSLPKTARFAPITNCSLDLDGVRSNIQVLTKEQLIFLLVKLNTYKVSAKELNVLDDLKISFYSVDEWMTDIKAKLDVIRYREEDTKLKDMEAKLDKLLSDEKKTELELDEIASLLG